MTAPEPRGAGGLGQRRESLRRATRHLVEVNPGAGSHRVAIRVSLGILVSLIALAATGHLPWAVFAMLGTFAAVYGGPTTSLDRWRLQAAAGLVMCVSVGVGLVVGLSPARAWLAVPVCALAAAAAAALSDRFDWQPPGPMFAVFGVASCSAIPSTPDSLLPGLGMTALTATFVVSLGALEARVLPSPPYTPPPTAGAAPRPPGRRRVHAMRCAVAVAIAGTLAGSIHLGHPYWAMIAAVIPLSLPTLTAQFVRGAHRVLGTFTGLGVAGILLVFPLPAYALVLLVAFLQALAQLLVRRHYGVAMVFITPAALLMGQLANPMPIAQLLTDRLIDTVLGIATGVALASATRDRA